MMDAGGVELLPQGFTPEVEPIVDSVPVPCEYIEAQISPRSHGGGTEQLTNGSDADDKTGSDFDADSMGRGWVVPPAGTRVDALFVVNATQLGVGRTDQEGPPVWLELSTIKNVDAIGDAMGDLQEVEITLGRDTTISAGWTLAFCDLVVTALMGDHSTSADSQVDVPSDADEPDGGLFSAKPVVRARSRRQAKVETSSAEQNSKDEQGEIASESAEVRPATSPADGVADDEEEWSRAGALELEDVTYLGGYPGQTRRRKRCTAVLSNAGLEISGPADLRIRLAWDSVQSIEAQNADEARFRMNSKIHTDSSALVVSCDGDVKILLEARDCPTIPLRSAIAQLIGNLPVVVT